MPKKLISLKDHNAARNPKPVTDGNGIACPICGGELQDAGPNAMLLSAPPKMRVSCSTCGWMGYRLA